VDARLFESLRGVRPTANDDHRETFGQNLCASFHRTSWISQLSIDSRDVMPEVINPEQLWFKNTYSGNTSLPFVRVNEFNSWRDA
jgi:hypothetical protein